jgi:ABC-type multidrug transport system fused ATPase/permease subunit
MRARADGRNAPRATWLALWLLAAGAGFAGFSPVSPSGLWAEASPSAQPSGSQAPATQAISASELARLSEISTRLAALNERLRTELEASKRNSGELEGSLETSTRELATLRLELEESRRSSSELARRAELSEQESIALREASMKAEGSLRNLEASFAAYRREAEERILALSAGRIGLVILAGAGWVLAILSLLFH